MTIQSVERYGFGDPSCLRNPHTLILGGLGRLRVNLSKAYLALLFSSGLSYRNPQKDWEKMEKVVNLEL